MSKEFDSVPQELKDVPHWLCWRQEANKKTPYNSRSAYPVDVSKSENWMTFAEASSHYERCKTNGRAPLSGIGFAFGGDGPFAGVDLDDCHSEKAGKIDDWARDIVALLSSYTEISPSGTGLKTIVRADVANLSNKSKVIEHGKAELFTHDKFFTITGRHYSGTPKTIASRQDEFTDLYMRLFGSVGAETATHTETIYGSDTGWSRENGDFNRSDYEITRRACRDPKFAKLHNYGDTSDFGGDESRADRFYLRRIAFFVGNSGHAQVERIARSSALCRDKWEDKRCDVPLLMYEVDRLYQTLRVEQAKGERVFDSPYNLTERGNGERFRDLHLGQVYFVQEWGKWATWNGNRWAVTDEKAIYKLIKQVHDEMWKEALALPDGSEARKKSIRWADSSESAARIKSMMSLARMEEGIAVSAAMFDRNPDLLNLQNGTYDLRKGEFRTSRQEDFLTKSLPVAYDANTAAPTWETFLQEIMPDKETREYLQTIVGYALSGHVIEHALFFFYGRGANGKSTFLNTLLTLFGDYGMQATPDLLVTNTGDSHPTKYADLFGKRFVSTVETEEGKRMAEATLKALTGGENVRARKMRADFFEFEPTHKIFMASNHHPTIRGTDEGIWRRIHMIPFTVQIEEGRRDKDLLDKLKAELPGILNWALRGCNNWYAQGLKRPQPVSQATQEYKAEQDIIGQFINECCETSSRHKVMLRNLYEHYREWCEASGEIPKGKSQFSNSLRERGIRVEKEREMNCLGIAVRH